jgi:hypothetical protein
MTTARASFTWSEHEDATGQTIYQFGRDVEIEGMRLFQEYGRVTWGDVIGACRGLNGRGGTAWGFGDRWEAQRWVEDGMYRGQPHQFGKVSV